MTSPDVGVPGASRPERGFVVARRSLGHKQFEEMVDDGQCAIEVTAGSGLQHVLILFEEDRVKIGRRDPHPSQFAPRWLLYEVAKTDFWKSYNETPGRFALPRILGVLEDHCSEDYEAQVFDSYEGTKAAIGWPIQTRLHS